MKQTNKLNLNMRNIHAPVWGGGRGVCGCAAPADPTFCKIPIFVSLFHNNKKLCNRKQRKRLEPITTPHASIHNETFDWRYAQQKPLKTFRDSIGAQVFFKYLYLRAIEVALCLFFWSWMKPRGTLRFEVRPKLLRQRSSPVFSPLNHKNTSIKFDTTWLEVFRNFIPETLTKTQLKLNHLPIYLPNRGNETRRAPLPARRGLRRASGTTRRRSVASSACAPPA